MTIDAVAFSRYLLPNNDREATPAHPGQKKTKQKTADDEAVPRFFLLFFEFLSFFLLAIATQSSESHCGSNNSNRIPVPAERTLIGCLADRAPSCFSFVFFLFFFF